MSTISVSPLTVQDDPTSEVIQLEILVKDSDYVGFFNSLEIWRSLGIAAGPYEELTADSWGPALMPKDALDKPASPVTGPSFVLVGETLELRVNEKDDILVVFSGTDPLTLSDIAAQITSQGQMKVSAYVDVVGGLVLSTLDAGTGAVLELTGGSAAPLLGLPDTSPAYYGHDARLTLVEGINSYQFSDLRGSSAYFYKTRFRNKLTGAVSEFSQAFGATAALGVTAPNLACGELRLVQLDGKVLRNQEVRVHSQFNGTIVEGMHLAGGDVIKLTDDDGYVSFTLVRGQRVAVAIIGTNLVRDILVPTDPTIQVFNLLDPNIASEDVFKVSVPDLIYAEQRTL